MEKQFSTNQTEYNQQPIIQESSDNQIDNAANNNDPKALQGVIVEFVTNDDNKGLKIFSQNQCNSNATLKQKTETANNKIDEFFKKNPSIVNLDILDLSTKLKDDNPNIVSDRLYTLVLILNKMLNLKSLDLSNNDIKNSPDAFSRLDNNSLENINLSNNNIANFNNISSGGSWIKDMKCPNLETLDLSNNKIHSLHPLTQDVLKNNFKQLKNLNLAKNKINQDDIKTLNDTWKDNRITYANQTQ